MYVPHYFKNENVQEVREFIEKNGFGILVSCGEEPHPQPLPDTERGEEGQTRASAAHNIVATHIPLLLDKDEQGRDILSGHIARMNPHHKLFLPPSPVGKGVGGLGSSKVLAIFLGPHTYVSSSWYSHENVPTWNYIAVHVYGTLKIIEGDRLYRQLKMLVDKYEEFSQSKVTLRQAQDDFAPPSSSGKGVGGLGSRVYLEKMSPSYIKKQMNGIVGFEILIDEIQAAYKLSQNRTPEDFENVIKELEKRGDPESLRVAEEMRKKMKHK